MGRLGPPLKHHPLTCAPGAEDELLAVVGAAVLVGGGDARAVVRARPQPGEDVHAAVGVLALTLRRHPEMAAQSCRGCREVKNGSWDEGYSFFS